MASNGEWGELAAVDTEMADLFDSLPTLPEPGQHEALDAFCARKNLTIADLVRVGTRLSAENEFVLVYTGPGYMKFRNMQTGKRWNYLGNEYVRMRIVHHHPEPSDVVLLAEGETDAAWLAAHYDCDVAIMGAGAGHFPSTYAEQLTDYELVLVALDNDNAGIKGADKVLKQLRTAMLFPPPANKDNDWCGANEVVALPPADVLSNKIENKVLVSAGELLAIEPPHVVSWFENALLPVGGQLILHGWAKSFKSFLALDICSMLSQGEPWCQFEPTEEPCKIAVMQYEIPWAYYQQRLQLLNRNAQNQELFQQNFQTFTPLIRPRFVAGNAKHEDEILRHLEESATSVFLLDPIRRATGAADLNSEKEVRPVLNFAARVQDLGVTVILTHHDNKTYSRSGGGDPLGMTGAGAFAGDADTIVSVSVPKGMTLQDPERNLTFTLRNAPAPGQRSMKMDSSGLLTYRGEPAYRDEGDIPEGVSI